MPADSAVELGERECAAGDRPYREECHQHRPRAPSRRPEAAGESARRAEALDGLRLGGDLLEAARATVAGEVAQVIADLAQHAVAGLPVASEVLLELGEEGLDGPVLHDAPPSTLLMPRANATHAVRSLESAASPAGVSA